MRTEVLGKMPSDSLLRIVALVIDGLSLGFLYAMIGLGITLVFGLGGILNLAIGVFMVIAILIVFELAMLGMTSPALVVVAIIIAIAATSALGYAIERSIFPLIYRSEGEERLLLGIFVTLGLAIVMEGLISLRWAGDFTVPLRIPSVGFFGTTVRGSSFVIIAVSLVTFFLMYLFFSRTDAGIATRTIMQDETGAVLCGIDITKMRRGIWVMSIGIAALAGILWGLAFSQNVNFTFDLTTVAIVVSIVGGMTSIVGVVIAGLALGIISTFITVYASSYLASIALFLIAIIVLLIKPEGLS